MSDVLALCELEQSFNPTLPSFKPPPRFGETRFEGYHPQDKTQEQAEERTQAFISQPNEAPFRWPWQKKQSAGKGLYLDGGFGVGKTHLLAAAYAAYPDSKIYLSFAELVHVIGVFGKEKAKAQLGDKSLYCIDEFELDDPGNTLIVKTFLAHVFEQGAKVITTSNTAPEAQGQGRFNAGDFKREIQSIAERFEVLHLEGPDYRKRESHAELLTAGELEQLLKTETFDKPKVKGNWSELFDLLRRHHPIHFASLLQAVGALYLTGTATIASQNDALRFVHFIDKVYDLNVGLRLAGNVGLETLFDASYRNSAYGKKHYRCLSRISELLEEQHPSLVL